MNTLIKITLFGKFRCQLAEQNCIDIIMKYKRHFLIILFEYGVLKKYVSILSPKGKSIECKIHSTHTEIM